MIKPFTLGLLALASAVAAFSDAHAATNYVIANQAAVGITKAFDDGENTVLAFADLDVQTPNLTDEAGKRIRFRRVGDYAVLPGRFTKVVVEVGGARGAVKVADLQGPGAVGEEAPASSAVASRAEKPGNKCATENATAPSADIANLRLSCHDGFWTAAAGAAVVASAVKPTVPATAEAAAAVPAKDKPPAYVPVVASGGATAAAKSATAVTAPVAAKAPVWTASAGSTLRNVVEGWVTHADWQLRWEFQSDFPIDVPVQYTGDFTKAVTDLLHAYAGVDDAPHACLYPDQRPKPLIRVIPTSRRCVAD